MPIMDGLGAVNWDINASLVVNALQINAAAGDVFAGTLDIGAGISTRLTVVLDDPAVERDVRLHTDDDVLPQRALHAFDGLRTVGAPADELGQHWVVVDGDLIAAARMDGSHTRVLRHAIRKAYTAAPFGRNTLALKRQMRDADRELSDYGDSNITTLIAGIVLLTFGTGPVRGFAVTLCLGIASSLFTAILGSRAAIHLIWGRRRKLAHLPV